MRVHAATTILVCLVCLTAGTGCGPGQPEVEASASAVPGADYEATLERIEVERRRLASKYARAGREVDRAAVRAEARAFVTTVIIDELFPAWLGMPWGLGRSSTANRAHAPGMTVACGYFVSAVLENAGLRVNTRFTYAQAPALQVQRTLAPDDVHRYFSVPAETLAAEIAGLGAGLYIIGLSNHIGFVVVDAAGVRLVHASYTGAQVVTSEPLATAQAIINSRAKGYFVSPVMHDDRLADLWLRGASVPLRKS